MHNDPMDSFLASSASKPAARDDGGIPEAHANLFENYEQRVDMAINKHATLVKHSRTTHEQLGNEQRMESPEIYSARRNYSGLNEEIVPRLPSSNKSVYVSRSLYPLAEWEGYVESISDDSFVARLVNVNTGDSLPEDEAVFSKSELGEYQLSHLEIGAIFRWVIGMQRLATGQRQRVSEVCFRRLPAHSVKEIQAAKEMAANLIESIDWDGSSKT